MSFDKIAGLFGGGGLLTGGNIAMQSQAAYREVQAQNASAMANAQILERQAEVSRVLGEQAVAKSEKEAADFRRGMKGRIGSMRAAGAASGVKVDTGSVADLQADTAKWGEYDAQSILYSGLAEKWRHDTDANNYKHSAKLTRATRRSPGMIAGATALGGATAAAQRYGYW